MRHVCSMIKLLVSDLDGTLLSNTKTISPENKEAILKAQDMGVRVILATGRGIDSTLGYAKELQMDKYGGYLVTNNGQSLYDIANKRQQTNGVISTKAAQKAFVVAKELRLQLILSSAHGLAFYTPKELIPIRAMYQALNKILPYFGFIFKKFNFLQLFGFLKSSHLRMLKRVEDVVGEYQKVGFAHIGPKILKVEPQLRTLLGDDLELMHVGDLWIDGAPKGITKLTGIHQVMALHQIQVDEVMTIGDSQNDTTMIQAFKRGIAMGNAEEEVKKVASEVTLTNSQNGVAAVIHKYILSQS
jgi:Cof subfamily protein (haloacid dehalogenase superfamily)